MIAALMKSEIFRSVALAAVAFVLGYAGGRIDGRSAGKVEQLKDTVAAIEKRGSINEDVENLAGYRLCLELGGVRDDCNKLRRVEQATESK